MCSEEDKKREHTAQRKRWMDTMKCENSIRETIECWEKVGQYVRNNREWREGEGESERWRRCERRREVSRDVEMGGGGGGGDEPPVLSCQCFLCRWGRRSAKSLSPTHTDTHASLYNGCFTLVPERDRLRQREGDMVRRRKGDMGEGGYWKKKGTAMRYREKGSWRKCLRD